MPNPRGRRANRTGKGTKARATSVPTPPPPQVHPTRDRSLDATCGRADEALSNSVPIANRVRLNATTNPQEPSRIENTISSNHASGNAFLVNKIVHSYPEKPSSECIQKLKITNPRWDRVEVEECHSDLCEEHLKKVRENESYKLWKNDDETRLLWIYSHTNQMLDPETKDLETGDQKRIVAAAVAKELEESLGAHKHDKKHALSYMFCRNSRTPELKLNHTAAILRSLMWLLSLTQESLTVRLEGMYNLEGKSIYEDENAKHALSKILLEWLKDTEISRVYLVVGAIDECHPERKQVLEKITTFCKDLPKVKWLITSDCDDIYINYYIKAELDRHAISFKTIHLNERSQINEGSQLNEGSHPNERSHLIERSKKRKSRTNKKPRGKGTKGTKQETKRGVEENAQVGEGSLDKGKGRASDPIPEENVEKYVGEFFKGAAGDNKNDTPQVSGWVNVANPERANGSKSSDEWMLVERPPLLPFNSGESTTLPQQGKVPERGNLNTRYGSPKGWCCVVQ